MELTADQLKDKYLWAKQPVKLYKLPGFNESVLETVEPGQVVGKVYSWVVRDGLIWWMFEYANEGGGFYYTDSAKGKFDIAKLQKQLIESGEIEPPKTSNYLAMGGIVLGVSVALTAKNPALRIVGGTGAAFIAGKMIVDKVKDIDLNPFD